MCTPFVALRRDFASSIVVSLVDASYVGGALEDASYVGGEVPPVDLSEKGFMFVDVFSEREIK